MSVDSLYAELGVDFQPSERKMFLTELADVARDYATSLGSQPRSPEGVDPLQELLEGLDKEMVEFSPTASVVALTKKLFTDLKIEAPPYITNLLQRFNFYLVNFPITLMPRPGWGFAQLDCIVEFNPDQPTPERAVAYQIFPHEEWQEVVHAWQGLTVGIDEKLEFKMDPAQTLKNLSGLSAPAKAAVEMKTAANAGLILGPFDYHIRRPKILSKGRGNVKVRWSLEGEEYVTQTEPQLGVVLQVPKEVSRVNIIGALVASRTFHLFTADLSHVLEYVTERTRKFFEKGAPATSKMRWDDITKGL